MTRREFLHRYRYRFLISFLLVGLTLFTIYQVAGISSQSLLTTPARRITDTQILGGEAYLFRDEELLYAPAPGIVDDLQKSGTKVSKDAVTARIYTDFEPSEIAEKQRELDYLNRMIAVLENSKVAPGTSLVHIEEFRRLASQYYAELRAASINGIYGGATEAADRMLEQLNRFAALTGGAQEISEALETLKAQKAELLGGTYISVANTRESGYYYSRSFVDCGESVFQKAELETLDSARLSDLKTAYQTPGETLQNTVGKVVYGYDWYLAVETEGEIDRLLKTGESFTVTFPENDSIAVCMECRNLIDGGDGRWIAVLYASVAPSSFSYLRVQTVEIAVSQCTGYYVPEQAIAYENGIEGVYILDGSQVRFRKIEVIYRGDGYCIAAEPEDAGEAGLALNDRMVIAGNNLYDGKVYK